MLECHDFSMATARFNFGVIFFLTNFKEILKFITVFTLGHSVTLIFATCPLAMREMS